LQNLTSPRQVLLFLLFVLPVTTKARGELASLSYHEEAAVLPPRMSILLQKHAASFSPGVSDGALPRRAWLDAYFVKFAAARIVAAKRIAYLRSSVI